jgi:nicotinate-nucleotide adenylyltransferase
VKLGVFGGTFDPPHVGHLIAAQDALLTLELDRILFIPARTPPHKQHLSVSSAEVRWRMLQAALAGDGRFEASDVELRRTGPSYTVDTLRELRGARPHTDVYLLLGVDQVREFQSWREPEAILELAHLVMLTRGGVEETIGSDILKACVPVTRIDISSTMIRERVAAGQSITYLVPAEVEEIIAAERLYSGGLG